ncbi:STAS domain-containing protein [Nonomuraea zeae]|uniref:Anti-sigma factor antagonist n=1 Tax=Nonomuraea zeae TaxID=1642303 RepID=A0A5S4F089_9ACTN|nr:STAS domain-containing protein [Nonomuraea zeae]TMR09364.1 STAS domain-containing protein [Nonomuraea zeae]
MPDFQLDVKGPIGDCAVLVVAGEIDLDTAPRIRERLLDLAGKGIRHVIADLTGVDFLDSTGLGVLVGGRKRMSRHDGSLILVTGSERILRVLRVTGLASVLPPRPTVLDAIGSDPHWRQAAERAAGSAEEWCARHGLS